MNPQTSGVPTLLLVDDEANILAALKRLLRRSAPHILSAGSGAEGLELLKQQRVDVIVSDQRMPGMTGVEFLRTVRDRYPDTIRIVLSGYTELQSVTDAINEGAIYKFLTKPWDDAQLTKHIVDAFAVKALSDENLRLNQALLSANSTLADTNRQLDALLQQQQNQLLNLEISLEVVHEILAQLPLPIFGLDDQHNIVFTNHAAQMLCALPQSLLGGSAAQMLPWLHHSNAQRFMATYHARDFQVSSHRMGSGSGSRGKLLVLVECSTNVEANVN